VHIAGSLSSAADSAPMKPLPSFNTSSNSALAFSTLPSVEQPFHSAGNWNATGGFKFGAVTSQPLSSTVTSSGQQPAECASAADVAVTSELTMQSPLLMSGKLTGHVSSQMPVSNSTQLDINAALPTVMSTTAVSPADAGSHQVDDMSGGEVPNCCSASAACVTSSLALAAAEYDSRQSVAVTSSDAVMPPVISTVSRTSAAAAATSPAFSLPLTATFTQQPASIFSFGKAAFAENSSRPLGVPATSALQFNATGCCFLLRFKNSTKNVKHALTSEVMCQIAECESLNAIILLLKRPFITRRRSLKLRRVLETFCGAFERRSCVRL